MGLLKLTDKGTDKPTWLGGCACQSNYCGSKSYLNLFAIVCKNENLVTFASFPGVEV